MFSGARNGVRDADAAAVGRVEEGSAVRAACGDEIVAYIMR
jgi:hypothetical protein